jgi:hypothetical protein
VRGVCPAKPAVFFEFHPVRMLSLVLGPHVVATFARAAGKGDFFSVCRHFPAIR